IHLKLSIYLFAGSVMTEPTAVPEVSDFGADPVAAELVMGLAAVFSGLFSVLGLVSCFLSSFLPVSFLSDLILILVGQSSFLAYNILAAVNTSKLQSSKRVDPRVSPNSTKNSLLQQYSNSIRTLKA